ncbi:hypothetical protein E2986_03666 [Frieseomelitta varia]|uniref:Uncharacterized protein n=1 Tax=Frieseomelitta varia TaxID=561572 RepID=A0A833VMZ2_9HYME|nr:uncharacterized protein LOC122531841 [Frieseomelitta varia]KAF3425096.1 hypothetical protein E2986_03666 [Frieseomelitta varia]
MNFSTFVLLIVVFINHSRIRYKVSATTENVKVTRRSLGITTDSDDVQTSEKEISQMDIYSKQNLIKLQELERIANTEFDGSNRKSKILRSLAFLAGLSVGGLAGAASSDIKTYTKLPPLSVNVDASRISPQVAAIYDPYPYVSYPSIFATSLGVYPFWDLLRLLSTNGLKFNPLNNNDECVQEAQKIESIRAPSNADSDKNKESEVKNDRNVEEKMASPSIVCIMQKRVNEKQSSVKNVIKKNINDLSATSGRQSLNKTTSTNTTQNSTTDNQTNPPSYGYYYGGYPQNINHIDVTTNSYEYPYHDYEHINYNLPPYDKPENFYSDKYHYYPVPVDSYPSSQFHQERIPGYLPGDYKKFLYTSDNIPPVYTNSDFRPLV